MSGKKTLYLIDASVYVFRAYYSLPDSIIDRDGFPVNAVYGFATFITKLIRDTGADHFAVAFDESLSSSFRNRLYPDYKANREPAPADLKRQFGRCREITQALGIASFSSREFEADDIIGTIANKMRKRDFKMVYVTNDKDMAQLLKPGDLWWDFAKDKKYKHSDVKDRYGVTAKQIIDWLALAGDAVDNIPGVPGIGVKTAATLLDHYDSLDKLYNQLDHLAESNIRGAKRLSSLLEEHRESALLSRELATIHTEAEIKFSAPELRRQEIKQDQVTRLADEMDFGEEIRSRLLDL